jgi:hypothetical protein
MAEPIEVVMNAATHRFEATLGDAVAFAEYELEPGAIRLPHTVVPPAFEGRGVGSGLARAALGYARDHGLMVRPACPFIAGYIGKHPEVQDLVDPAWRKRLAL